MLDCVLRAGVPLKAVRDSLYVGKDHSECCVENGLEGARVATGNQPSFVTMHYLQVEGWDWDRPPRTEPHLWSCLFQLVLKRKVAVQQELCRP